MRLAQPIFYIFQLRNFNKSLYLKKNRSPGNKTFKLSQNFAFLLQPQRRNGWSKQVPSKRIDLKHLIWTKINRTQNRSKNGSEDGRVAKFQYFGHGLDAISQEPKFSGYAFFYTISWIISAIIYKKNQYWLWDQFSGTSQKL